MAADPVIEHTDGMLSDWSGDAPVSVAEAAARVGLTPATLRTWHRRYGLGPSARTAGGHRRYDATDLARLRLVQQLVDGGVAPGEAVAACLELAPDALHESPQLVAAGTGRAGGGNVVALPGGDDVQRGLARAATSLDGAAVFRRVSDLLSEHGVVATWEQILTPVLIALGERWSRTRRGVEIEHVTSEAITRALTQHGSVVDSAARPVLLACMPDELHCLPLLALQAALRESGVPTVSLGARVPLAALQDSIIKVRPRRLVLWAQLPQYADPAVLAELPSQRPPLRVILAGPGWAAVALPASEPQALRPTSLTQALEFVGVA